MSVHRISSLLCASLALATPAVAQDATLFVTQLRLPARGITLDVFAWRDGSGVAVDASILASLGISAPNSNGPISLSSIPGLSYEEPAGDSAIVITCALVCYSAQRIDLRTEERPDITPPASGGYLNYEAEVQWVDGDGANAAGIFEAALFGRWGVIESSWVARTGDDGRGLTRLETSWTIDRPKHGIRTRLGDSVLLSASGVPVRFGGIQIGRHFGLTPSLVTFPTPGLGGEAESASTIQLYVDGALRAQGQVEAGPFVIEHAPVISGAGEAELVITDVLGRQQTITRPFFVSTTVLREGLSDWSAALGAERRAFGRKDAHYGDTFIAARYRRGVTDTLTLEAALEHTDNVTTAQAGATFSAVALGQVYVSRAQNDGGGFTTASWLYDARAWSMGAQFEQRDGDFQQLGRPHEDNFRRSASANIALNLGDYGAMALTAAQFESDDEPLARTFSLSYSPDVANGGLSFRILQTESDESELSAGVSFSFTFGDDVSAHLSADSDNRGISYRASAQQGVTPDRIGWRTRVTTGTVERLEAAVLSRTWLGDSMAQVASVNGATGARLRHAGSAGWIDETSFAGRRIEGAFALVDAGAANVSVTRNHLDVGVTGRDGRVLVPSLRPYDANAIGINADDLPLDRAPASPQRNVVPSEHAGVVLRFADARERLVETRVRFANGATPARGAILVRSRDGERFPIGSDGRVVLTGAQSGDVVELHTCLARADEIAAAAGLELICAAAS